MSPLRSVCSLLLMLAGLALAQAAWADPPGPSQEVWLRWSLRAEDWLMRGEDEPQLVLEELLHAEPQVDGPLPPAWRRLLARTQGLVAARSGLHDDVARARGALQALATLPGQALLVQGDLALLAAHLADVDGEPEVADREAQVADQSYRQACEGPLAAADCDLRAWWRALRLRAQRADAQGSLVEALDLAERSRALAERAGDLGLEAWSLGLMAVFQQALGQPDQARSLIAQADRVARRLGEPRILARVRFYEARMQLAAGDAATALRLMQQALALAAPAGSPRLEAQILPSLSDLLRRAGRAREALAAVERAYPVLRRHQDLRNQPILLHNGGLARLQLGQVSQGRADLDAALRLWEKAGARAAMAVALQEASDALAALGDVRGALQLLHREQDLRQQINQENREALLAQMRTRYRSEAERRELDLLERENALRSSRLQTQSMMERAWVLLALLLVLAAGVVALLMLRARDTTRRLRHNEALLRVQSERDPLTGLANRRHFRDVLAAGEGGQAFRGALLLVDVDHFKRVNDEYGHPAGDAVLIDVARRLSGSVRAQDVVCRWGGEEFLIHAPGLQGDALASLARRVLGALGDEPVTLPDGRLLPISASIGFAAFPLAEHLLPLSWERAVNLVDMALYTAKSMGRDRVVGLESVRCADARALQQLEQDFEAARLAGEVQLRVEPRLRGEG